MMSYEHISSMQKHFYWFPKKRRGQLFNISLFVLFDLLWGTQKELIIFTLMAENMIDKKGQMSVCGLIHPGYKWNLCPLILCWPLFLP